MAEEKEKGKEVLIPEIVGPEMPVQFKMSDADALIEMGEKAQQMMEAMIKIRRAAMMMTNINDWTDMGGKPYLTAGGAMKLRSAWGVSYGYKGDPLKVPIADGHYRYDVKMEFIMKSQSGKVITIEAVGSRASNEKFFTTEYEWTTTAKGREKIERTKGALQVDEGDVRKSACTNCIERGITEILGFKNMTWKELEEAGIRKEDLPGRVSFDKKQDKEEKKKPPERQPEKPPEKPAGNSNGPHETKPPETPPKEEGGMRTRGALPEGKTQATEKQRNAVYALLKKSGKKLEDVSAEILQEVVLKDDLLSMEEASQIIKALSKL